MPPSRLTRLQEQVLTVLAREKHDWVLTRGGALAGFHTRHRGTRDLDLFWRSRSEIQTVRAGVVAALEAAELDVALVQSSPAFLRLNVTGGHETLVVDLVADPDAAIEPPLAVELGPVSLRVDSRHEILVNKLCALVQRSELRDLVDVVVLLENGGELERALKDAPRKDAGFSPLTLVWLLREMPVAQLARPSGESDAQASKWQSQRDDLIRRVAELS